MPKISQKKPARKGAKKKTGRRVGLFCLFLFVASTLAAGFYFMVLYPTTPRKITLPILSEQAKKKPLHQKAELPAPLYEEPSLPQQAPPVAIRSRKTEKTPLAGRPLVAIVIDDMGNRQNTGRALLALDLPLSFSFLPSTPFPRSCKRRPKPGDETSSSTYPLSPWTQNGIQAPAP